MLSEQLASQDGEWRKAARAEEFLAVLQDRLSPGRVEHSVSVARVMWTLARRLPIEPDQAVAAGLLHDLCKPWKNDTMRAAAARYGIPVNAVQEAKPSLLHGRVAAEECRRRLDITDPSVYEAICWHVTGRAGLDILGQALYFADFSEPRRSHPEAAEARACFEEQGFLPALRFVADAKLAHLRNKGALIDPDTEAFRAWLETKAV